MDERRLRKLFQFTENDLDANRHGQFSENQRKRLMTAAKAEQKSARESAMILFVVAAAGLAVGLTVASIAPTALSRILFLALLGILWPSAWAGKGIKLIRAARALREPRLREVNGQAHMIRHADGSFGMKIGDHEFDLDGNPSGVVMEGHEYTFYYLEATEEILSVDYLIKGT